MSKKHTVRPGGRVPDSGIYVDQSGKAATLVKGKTAPPTTESGQKWKQAVDTNPNN
jgi:hypothetical protein